jgi:hypothetical protein
MTMKKLILLTIALMLLVCLTSACDDGDGDNVEVPNRITLSNTMYSDNGRSVGNWQDFALVIVVGLVIVTVVTGLVYPPMFPLGAIAIMAVIAITGGAGL